MQALIKDVTDVHKTLLVVTGVTLWQPHPGETQRRVMVPYGIKWFKSVHGDAALTNHRSVLKLLASSGSSLLVQEFCPWWCCHSEAPICYQAPGFIYIYTVYIYFVWPVKLICGGWFFPSESLGGSFFFNPACSDQLICITINFWIHWTSYKPNKYIRQRENERCA